MRFESEILITQMCFLFQDEMAEEQRMASLRRWRRAALVATRMSTYIESSKAWMSSNRLRLNPSKTELIWLGSSRRLHHCSGTGMRVLTFDPMTVSDLGVLIDSGMSLARHVNYILGVFLPTLTTVNHPSILHRGHCSCSGTCTHTHVTHTDYCNRLLVSCSS